MLGDKDGVSEGKMLLGSNNGAGYAIENAGVDNFSPASLLIGVAALLNWKVFLGTVWV